MSAGFLFAQTNDRRIFVRANERPPDFCSRKQTTAGFLFSQTNDRRIFVRVNKRPPDFCSRKRTTAGFLFSQTNEQQYRSIAPVLFKRHIIIPKIAEKRHNIICHPTNLLA